MVGDLLAFHDGFAHILRHWYAFDPIARCSYQLGAQFLQGSHFTLELRFGRAVVLLLEFVGFESDGAAICIWHDGQRMAIGNGCYDTCFEPFL